MAAGQKKVIVRLLSGGTASGYLPACGFANSSAVSLMSIEGRLIALPLNEIRYIAYVKDFNLSDLVDPERIGRRTYPARPRGEGIWIRIVFEDDEILEGLSDTGVLLLDSLLEDRGLFLTPPEVRANTQRLYVPRAAMADLKFVAVITTAAKRQVLNKPLRDQQPRLFADR